MGFWRRLAGVAIFDRAAIREVLEDPRALYQAIGIFGAVLALNFLGHILPVTVRDIDSSIFVTDGGNSALPPGMVIATAMLAAGWIISVAVIMLLGNRVLLATSRPSWRAFISVWGFAQVPVIASELFGLTRFIFGDDSLMIAGPWCCTPWRLGAHYGQSPCGCTRFVVPLIRLRYRGRPRWWLAPGCCRKFFTQALWRHFGSALLGGSINLTRRSRTR